MGRTQELITWALLGSFVLLVTLMFVAVTFGTPKAVSCVDPNPGGDSPSGHTPAVIVRVTTDRNGHIVERNLFSCTLYFYEAPPPSR